MRKKGGIVVLIICAILFVLLRLIPIKKTAHEERVKEKPRVPYALLSHPWIVSQKGVTTVNPEMVRDLSATHTFCEGYGCQPSFLIETLQSLQGGIPFQFPADLYNVLCIVEFPHNCPYPFHVYKRLYLGESEIGFPFYLDVRVFEEGETIKEEVIRWHQARLDGEINLIFDSQQEVIFTSKGNPTQERAHGFGTGARGLFVDAKLHEGKLFVLYAEAPLTTFRQHESVFKQLIDR